MVLKSQERGDLENFIDELELNSKETYKLWNFKNKDEFVAFIKGYIFGSFTMGVIDKNKTINKNFMLQEDDIDEIIAIIERRSGEFKENLDK
ncbi:MAG: hypothetical protein M1462_05150 [Candidatus Thermoplasmatota archaeon]|jgi:hypothetical protein|uniref:hypothetical protein n=1 Tax=Ferroplasma sp. TaxID=2591003 RepID=UPI000389522C|nr:hypothetical protein [Ferroplasma sp.]EQB72889.1 MAG: hypothetical protein AMDU4_FER2C00125G0001 [Ferroplasma sp. Type II]EQB72947.1 MAG: hypothetical protein AMDU4_FER2C00114G0003 [Ferroplasma sp. Type II]MCL4311796.1 hypothetical protein [Candidatus Thermoplasmatota archaeon]HIH59857.1 hypothetical protein [Ferroplasma sp.]